MCNKVVIIYTTTP